MLAAVEFGAVNSLGSTPDVLVLAAAIAARRCLEFAYPAKRGRASPNGRADAPRPTRQRWYLYAWDRQRQDWRNFRLDRITDAERTEVRSGPALPVDDLAGHLQERFHSPKSLRMTLTLHAGA